MLYNILVADDFSSAADNALAWAADAVRGTQGRVTVLHVIPFIPPTLTPEPMAIQVADEDEIEACRAKLQERAAHHALEAAIEVVVAPHIGETILARAKLRGANLIVMGTHGRRGLGRLLVGSVAEHVMRHSECPLVTVRAMAA